MYSTLDRRQTLPLNKVNFEPTFKQLNLHLQEYSKCHQLINPLLPKSVYINKQISPSHFQDIVHLRSKEIKELMHERYKSFYARKKVIQKNGWNVEKEYDYQCSDESEDYSEAADIS